MFWIGTGHFADCCNLEMVRLKPLDDENEINEVKAMLERHVAHTASTLGASLLDSWPQTATMLVKVLPKDYERMQTAIQAVEASGLSGEAALMAAFAANNGDLNRASGN
jgi:glutamate synthase (ferredoxin)